MVCGTGMNSLWSCLEVPNDLHGELLESVVGTASASLGKTSTEMYKLPQVKYDQRQEYLEREPRLMQLWHKDNYGAASPMSSQAHRSASAKSK